MEADEATEAGMPLSKKLMRIALISGILVLVAALTTPLWLKPRLTADRQEALDKVRQIGALLKDFEADYGRFPDDETALEVERRTKTSFTLSGKYSNDYFRQLLTDGRPGRTEKPFWCKTPLSPSPPDDDFSSAAKALEAGEVGFSYIMASQTQGQSSKDEPSRTVVVAPSYRFYPDWTFDPEPFAGRAVALRLDMSAAALQIRGAKRDGRDGKAVFSAKKTLGDVGADTPWGMETNPVMRAPEPRGGWR